MPPQQNDPYQPYPPEPVPEEHPFIEPQLAGSNSSYQKKVLIWYATRIGAVVLVLGLLIAGGIGIYNASRANNNADIAQEQQDQPQDTQQFEGDSQELYDGDGSDISQTAEPDVSWTCTSGFKNDTRDETKCVGQKKSTVALTKTYTCPSDYIKYGTGASTTCQKVVGGGRTEKRSASTSYSCPKGYTRAGSSCNRKTTKAVTVTYSCPSGYTLSGKTCTKSTTYYGTVIATCKGDGFKKSGSGTKATCTKTINPNKNGKCKKNFTKKGKKCVRTKTPSFSCPSGYAKSGSGRNTICSRISVSTRSASVKKSCSSGYTRSGDTCVKTTKRAATKKYSCSSGYRLSGSSCYRTIGGTVVTAKPSVKTSNCPSGYKRLSGGERCEKTTPEVKAAKRVLSCDDGWELLKDEVNGAQCVLVKDEAA